MFMLGDHVLVFSLCCGGRVAGEARLQLPMTRHMWLGCCWHGTCEYAECGDTEQCCQSYLAGGQGGDRFVNLVDALILFKSEYNDIHTN